MRGKALKEKNQCSNISVLVKITQGPTCFSMGILEDVKWQPGSDCKWLLRQKLKNINSTLDPLFMANAIKNVHFFLILP